MPATGPAKALAGAARRSSAETPARTMGNTRSWPVLPQADAGSTTLIRVDEPDAGLLKHPP
jgi:hypothetical protein